MCYHIYEDKICDKTQGADSMSKKIDIIVANPAGNTTIFVLTPVPVEEYGEITESLLKIDFGKDFGVRFTCPDS